MHARTYIAYTLRRVQKRLHNRQPIRIIIGVILRNLYSLIFLFLKLKMLIFISFFYEGGGNLVGTRPAAVHQTNLTLILVFNYVLCKYLFKFNSYLLIMMS